MSQRPLLLDEMLSAQIAIQLPARGHDVSAVVENHELISLPDADLLAHATEQGRCLVTRNVRDFAALDRDWKAQGRVHGGIVYLANQAFPQNRGFLGAVVQALDTMIRDNEVPEEYGDSWLARKDS